MVLADFVCLIDVQLRREHFGALLKHLEDLQSTLDTDEGADGAIQQ